MSNGDGAKGYHWPTPIDPGAYRCIKVYVPDDTVYFANFWASYEFFTKWLAWARDPAKTGADVAAIWKVGYDVARAEWEAGRGCGVEAMDVRQNSSAPCTLEKTFDDGDTWLPFANLRLCSPQIRRANGWLEWKNPDTDTWEKIIGSDYYPQYDEPQIPTHPDPPPGEEGNCLAAENAAAYWEAFIDQFLVGYNLTSNAAGIAAVIIGLVVALIVAPVWIGVVAFITAIVAQYNLIDYTAQVAAFDWDALKCLLYCAYQDDGTLHRADYEYLLASMRAQVVNPGVWETLAYVFEIVGMTGVVKSGAGDISVGDCGGCDACNDCWLQPLDFATDEYTFFPSYDEEHEQDLCDYVPGVGWASVLSEENNKTVIYLIVEFDDPIELKDIEWLGWADMLYSADGMRVRGYYEDVVIHNELMASVCYAGDHWYIATGINKTVDKILVNFNTPSTTASLIIKQVKVNACGVNKWE